MFVDSTHVFVENSERGEAENYVWFTMLTAISIKQC